MINFFDMKMEIDPVTGECRNGEQVYSHFSTDGVMRHFAVERIAKYLEQQPDKCVVVRTPIVPSFAEHRLKFGGVEEHRLKRIKYEDIMIWPPIAVDLNDGTKLMIDGTHRYVAAHFIYKMKDILIRAMPLGTWEQFLIKVPQIINDKMIPQLLNQDKQPMDSRIK